MRAGIVALLIAVFSLALYFSLVAMVSDSPQGASPRYTHAELVYPNHVQMTVFHNDSVADLTIARKEEWWDSTEVQFAMQVFPNDVSCFQVLWDSVLYAEKWDTLSQPRFWRRIMQMGNDSALVNMASSRQVLDIVGTRDWDQMPDTTKERYKDSLRARHQLAPHEPLYITSGKNHYYAFHKVLPSIGRGIRVFNAMNVDPWFAQAILLIESPGKLQYSPVGAYGSFQLMKSVAEEHGLIVNDSIDEREDFVKAARAAASLIARRCLPQCRWMMRKRNIPFREKDLWFRLLVLHVYHAGAGNVDGVLEQIKPSQGGISLIQEIWRTEFGGFKNASQNYSQVALASLLELDRVMASLPDSVCREKITPWREEDFTPDTALVY